jgi:hypothetical protein
MLFSFYFGSTNLFTGKGKFGAKPIYFQTRKSTFGPQTICKKSDFRQNHHMAASA